VTFRETPLQGSFLIEPDRLADERGFFARTYCYRELEEHGMNPRVVQCSISYSKQRGTLRGIHYQGEDGEEAKLVRCTAGAIFDVMVDLRKASKTYLEHFTARLDSENRLMLFVPEGFAHGFVTLEDGTEVTYQMSEFYRPGAAMGIRWNDPALGVRWPFDPVVISERDQGYPDISR
jgi:dTDP-4-dehydrorhamnose 3,5-epimerase